MVVETHLQAPRGPDHQGIEGQEIVGSRQDQENAEAVLGAFWRSVWTVDRMISAQWFYPFRRIEEQGIGTADQSERDGGGINAQ